MIHLSFISSFRIRCASLSTDFIHKMRSLELTRTPFSFTFPFFCINLTNERTLRKSKLHFDLQNTMSGFDVCAMCSVCLPAPSRARRAQGCWRTCAPCGACAVVAQSKAARGHMARGAPLQRCVLCVGPAARRLRDDSSVEPLASLRPLELQTSEQVPAVCHLSQICNTRTSERRIGQRHRRTDCDRHI